MRRNCSFSSVIYMCECMCGGGLSFSYYMFTVFQCCGQLCKKVHVFTAGFCGLHGEMCQKTKHFFETAAGVRDPRQVPKLVGGRRVTI